MHEESHPDAGKKRIIKDDRQHHGVPNFGGSEIRIEDWWDKLTGGSWMFAEGNPACLNYAMRSVDLPIDDEVLYGKINNLGYLVHVSELKEDK